MEDRKKRKLINAYSCQNEPQIERFCLFPKNPLHRWMEIQISTTRNPPSNGRRVKERQGQEEKVVKVVNAGDCQLLLTVFGGKKVWFSFRRECAVGVVQVGEWWPLRISESAQERVFARS